MSDLPPPLKPFITVQDAIHGRIWLTELEQTLVNTPEFQRLRHISQLGLANFVFPTATHSRLAHSLGATHVMGWMLRQPSLQTYFKDREKLIPLLRLAALLHDLGHYPFSHLGENVYGAIAYGAFDEYGEGRDLSVFDTAAQARRHADASHELLTADVIRNTRLGEIIDKALGTFEERPAREVLIDIIEGTYFDSVCHSLISSDLDCDRLDYLIRDSAAAGLAYGQVDLGYLIENLLVEEHPKYGPVLAVDLDHGYGAVEHYLHARYFHYARFITHKTIAAAELLLAVAMLELARIGRIPTDASAIRKMVGTPNFLALTDAAIWTAMHEARGFDLGSAELTEASASLVDRTLLKCAISLEALESDDEEIYEHVHLDKLLGSHEQKKRVAEAAGVPIDSFCYKRATIRLTGIPARVAPKVGEVEKYEWIQTVNVARPGEEPRPAVLHRGLLQHLSTRRWGTRRVFVREPSLDAQRKDDPAARKNTDLLQRYLRRELAH